MNTRTVAIPGPKRQPLVGNLLQIPKGRLVQHVLGLSREFDGIFLLDFAGLRVPFVYDADLVAELSDERRFRKVIRPPLSLLRRIGGDGLFTAHSDDKPWGKAHRILMPAFGARAMKGYFGAMLEIAQALVRKWETAPGRDILVADDMTRLTLDTISLAGFGYRFDSFASDALHPFLAAMVNVLSHTMAQLTKLPLPFVPDRSEHRIADDIALMNALVDDVIRRRREQPVETPDLLNLMLSAVDPETGETLDDANIRHHVLTFLIAGHETTSGLLSFALYMLLRNPHVLAQAYAEVDRVLPGDTVPEYGHLAKLDVIERVLKETLRLWPTAPGYTVAPYEDTVIGGRYRIRKDRSVSVSIPGLHRDPKVWDDPDRFDIDRFLPEAEAARHPHAYKPFGNGQRACIGRQFALTEAKLALALILQKFALYDPYDYRLQIKETLTLKPDRFYIRVRRRQPHERLTPAAAAEAAPPSGPAADLRIEGAAAPFAVLYGSSLGTARDLAEQIAARAEAAGFAVTLAPLDEGIEALPEAGTVVVVASTYNGRAADGGRRTEEALAAGSLQPPPRPKLRYAVLGCGNSQWASTYQAFPKLVDGLLAQTGAQAIVPRGEADGNGDFDGDVDRWLTAFWTALGAQVEAASELAPPAVTVAVADPDRARAEVLPRNAISLTVISNSELVGDPAGLWDFSLEAPRSSVRHLVLRLPAAAAYRTGDHLAVFPRNQPELVRAVAERLGLEPDTVVVLGGDRRNGSHLPLNVPVTVERLLGDFVELQDPAGRRDLRRLLQYTRCPYTRGQLEALLTDDAAATERFRREVVDAHASVFALLQRFPAIELPLDAFLDLCSPLRPRFYSISSSAEVSPDGLALTVGVVEGRATAGGAYKGTASAYLQGLAPGDALIGFVRSAEPAFAPPADPALPMILIGPGTGFAPFRGFLEERAAQRAAGVAVAPSQVFYGCRHPQHDWFYRTDMERWQRDGIAKLHLAFSCVPEHPYRFVQDALWAQRDAVWAALEAGAVVYVCGDGRSMAPAVRDCLVRIHRDRLGSGKEESSAWLEGLVRTGRYRQDIFGTG